MRTLLPRQREYEPVPLDWTPDGGALLSVFRHQDGRSDLVLVPLERPQRHLHTIDAPGRVQARLSPDGRFAVVSVRTPAGLAGPAYIVATDGSRPPVALERDYDLADWSPDGGHIVGLLPSTSTQHSLDAWLVPIADGARSGDPVLVASNLGAVHDLWVSRSGSLSR